MSRRERMVGLRVPSFTTLLARVVGALLAPAVYEHGRERARREPIEPDREPEGPEIL